MTPEDNKILMRPLLYTDTIEGKQVCRDDMWVLTTEELKSVGAVLEAARRCERQDTATRAEDDSTSPEEFTDNLAEGGFSWNNLVGTIRNHDKQQS